jgi:hypothetical protein
MWDSQSVRRMLVLGCAWLLRIEATTRQRLQVESTPTLASVVTLKPAIRGHFKTGQRDWPET